MPELPEVETIVRDLRPHLRGRRLEAVLSLNPVVLRFPSAESFRAAAEGAVFGVLGRRGKFIHAPLSSGEHLVVHLGMTGTLTLDPAAEPVRPHTHLRLRLDSGQELRYRDPRRFGRVLLGSARQLTKAGLLPSLGPDPLARTFAGWPEDGRVRSSRRAVKAVLLDQQVVAGCGNIYADEALYLGRLRPTRAAASLSASQWARLAAALTVVMREAIRRRGTSFSDYRDGFGARGEAYESLMVYGRAGLPCVRCGRKLVSRRIAGRTTVYCRWCQR
ncbi:MAG: bifunctional DNA-formamidopyrimidine glycosylase/DNA-(apurinic or apyrimidinic site) lyase [Candidatus Dormibacteraeota bacterium]|nr:bifunctional DNA-formamidopyrimidine glycosylase/DNA-(apurinic or apyrimidinic site) lyase [Candidatus Dormibacteraeota bacterium]